MYDLLKSVDKISLRRYEKMFVSLNIYGNAIGVTYRGGDRYRTRCGALFTLATYILIIINAFSLFIAFHDGSKQEELAQSTKIDRFNSEKVDLVE